MTTKLVIQIVLLMVIAVMAVHAVSKRVRGDIGTFQLSVWLTVWLCGALVVIFHEETTALANRLGVGRGADLVTYVSVPVLFYTVFRLLIRTERLNRDVTALTRAIAMESLRREEGAGASQP